VSRFIIVGTGAIGTYVGGCLATAGANVSFVGRQPSLDALAAQGLRITDLDGADQHVRPEALRLAQSLGGIAREFDDTTRDEMKPGEVIQSAVERRVDEALILLVCVKGGATENVAREIHKFCPAGSTVVSLQNGVENVARLKTHAPSMNILAGMVPYNVVLKAPGHTHRATSGTMLIERNPASEAFVASFAEAGLNVELRGDMTEVQWGKLLLNLNNPINALSNLPLKPQLEDRDYRRVLAALQIEALSILRAANIRPAQVGKAPPKLLPKILKLPNWLFKRAAASMLKMDASARSSMSADLYAGRPTETDDLCGAVVRLAKSMGREAPANQAMAKLINEYQAGQAWTGEKLLAALSQR
jgi:2-dehydropantoate 2-reductase